MSTHYQLWTAGGFDVTFFEVALVGWFSSRRSWVFQYSRYSMGSLRGEALYNARVKGSEVRPAASPQEMQGSLERRTGVDSVSYLFRHGRFCITPYMEATLFEITCQNHRTLLCLHYVASGGLAACKYSCRMRQ
jgi:hypothetical protein